MKSLVLEKNGYLVYKSVPNPTLECDECLVKIHSAGICNSDIARAYSNKAYHYPLIMGHEIAGTVIKCGNNVSKIKENMQVAIFPLKPCFSCEFCKEKKWVLCKNYNYYGSRCDGGFAEYLAVKEWNLIPIVNNCPLEYAALTEPVAVAIHTVNAIDKSYSKNNLAIIGGGFIGMCTAFVAEQKKCFDSITIFDRNQFKCDLAESWGFESVCIDSDEDQISKYSNEFKVVIEGCGAPSTYNLALDICASSGLVIWMGNIQGDLTIASQDVSRILRRELTIKGVWNSHYQPNSLSDWTDALEMIATDKRIQQLVTHRIALSKGVETFKDIYSVRKNYRPHRYLKVMLDMVHL